MDESLEGTLQGAEVGWETDAHGSERCDRERRDHRKRVASLDAAIRLAQVVSGRFPQAALGGLASDLREVRAYIGRMPRTRGAA
ncbi:MAG: hypothetical protein HY608_06710 [Planctomycetes bacterium]|nr:hypothetical protein [Planctomycetota bacterium]